ncbi:MAG: hypothetical protein LBJ67_18245 [Planctomycetaceae bacterium]|nr:hypothetical protein [Planctomycetaceae bacterium]
MPFSSENFTSWASRFGYNSQSSGGFSPQVSQRNRNRRAIKHDDSASPLTGYPKDFTIAALIYQA